MPDPQGGWLGKPCPKCAYVRAPSDANPDWQCPRCHVAYAKFVASPVRARLAAEGREMAAEAGSDLSLVALIGANLVALLVAYATKMSLRDLMLVYWIQSVVIGVTNVIRIARLRGFATDGFTMNDQPVQESPRAKGQVALFFALHYGFFHAGYLLFILVAPRSAGGGLAPLYVYAILALVFAANHAYSLRHNLARDARGRPNIGTLMMLPYARIVPMHLTIILGGLMTGSTFAFFLFGLLKTAADVVMHVAEHHILGKQAESAPTNT
jgi:hypothetical protein